MSALNYNEIQNPRKRKSIIDFDRLMDLLGFENYDDLKDAHSRWVDNEMQADNHDKETKWTQSMAVGSRTFIEKIKESLGFRATGRKVIYGGDTLYNEQEKDFVDGSSRLTALKKIKEFVTTELKENIEV